jgi:anti-anti-sigma factor
MNNSQSSIKVNPEKTALLLSGRLNFVDVVELRKLGKSLIQAFPESKVVLDLKEVKSSDNSALVLLVAWIRDAHKMDKSIVFREVPEFLFRMAQVFGLNDLLML